MTITPSQKFVLKKPNLQPHQTEEYKKNLKKFARNGYATRNSKSVKYQDKNKIKSPLISYTYDQIIDWLKNPVLHEERLRTLSNYLYNIDPQYKSIINTMAGMPTFNWKLTMNSRKSNKTSTESEDEYLDALEFVDNLNLPHELVKCLLVALKEDWYFGYLIEGYNSSFILPLDSKYCRAVGRDNEYGTNVFAFNFAYFSDKEDILETYPSEFKRKYQKYKDKLSENWIQIDSRNGVCFKFNEEIPYAIPYYATMFPSLMDKEFYKEIKKDRAENEILQVFLQQIPVDENGLDKFAIDLPTAMQFHEHADDVLPKSSGVITSPMKIEAIKTERSKNDNDYVVQAYRDIYTDAGIPQHLYNSDNNTSIGLGKAINVNEQIIYRFYRQAERVINRILRFKFPTLKLKFKFHNVTTFNQADVAKLALTNAQNGIGTAIDIASISGTSPYEFISDIELEHDILKIRDRIKPLQSTHTQSGDSSGGRPSVGDDASDSTVVNRDNDVDTNRQS